MTTLPPEANDGQGAEEAAQASVPPAAPQYEAPPAGAQQAAPQYQPAPAANPVSNLQLNYWLSVFFTWIPALIFYIVDKDKGDQRLRQLHAANLNFSLLRIFVVIAAYIVNVILVFIPYVGAVLALLVLLAAYVVPFVFHIIAATKVQQAYQNGQADPFIFNIPMVK